MTTFSLVDQEQKQSKADASAKADAKANAKTKCGGSSTAQCTMILRTAPVGMTHLWRLR
jgi:hypothetical protein